MKKYFLYNFLIILALAFSTINAQWSKTNFTGNGSVNAILSYGQNVFVGTQSGGVYVSRDNGSTWAEANNGMPSSFIEVVDLLYTGGKILAAVKYGGVYVSTDDGASWNASSAGLPGDQYEYQLAGEGSHIFFSTDKGVFHSGDGGANWSAINSGLTDLDVRSVYFDGANLICGTYGNGVFKSALGSFNWTSASGSIPGSFYVNRFTGKDSKIFAATSGGGIYISNDTGQNWVATGGAWGSDVLADIIISGNSLFASIGSGDGGILYSSDFGANWSVKNEGFSQYPYSSAISANQTTVFAGLTGDGEIWKRAISDFVTGIDDEIETIRSYSLSQNYPNPFSKGSGGNPSTTIEYRLPENGFVSLKIYDILGSEVAELVNQEKSAGIYHITFDAGSELASGIYFYRISVRSEKSQIENFIQTKKMMLVK